MNNEKLKYYILNDKIDILKFIQEAKLYFKEKEVVISFDSLHAIMNNYFKKYIFDNIVFEDLLNSNNEEYFSLLRIEKINSGKDLIYIYFNDDELKEEILKFIFKNN